MCLTHYEMSKVLYNKTLTIPSSPDRIEDCLSLIHNIDKIPGIDNDLIFRLNIVILESVQNAIIHGNRNNENKFVHFILKVYNDKIVIKVQDEGQGFKLDLVESPLLSRNMYKEYGRGIYFITCLSSSFRTLGKGNIVKIIMKIK